MVYDILTNFIADLLSGGITKQAGRLRKVLQRSSLTFVVYGNRACGKTTLINRMLGRPVTAQHAPTLGRDMIGKFDYVALSLGRNIQVRNFSDYGGDRSNWPLWDDAFTRDRPNGIIFMVDHEHLDQHEMALRYFVDFLALRDRRFLLFKGRHTAARQQVRAVMLLINKQDVWRRSVSIATFLEWFGRDLARIEHLKIPVIVHSCSALDGSNTDQALSEFFKRIL